MSLEIRTDAKSLNNNNNFGNGILKVSKRNKKKILYFRKSLGIENYLCGNKHSRSGNRVYLKNKKFNLVHLNNKIEENLKKFGFERLLLTYDLSDYNLKKFDYNVFEVNFYVKKKDIKCYFDEKLNNGFSNEQANFSNVNIGYGIVLYFDKLYYGNNIENENRHIPCSTFDDKNFYSNIIRFIIENIYNISVKKILCGHEHGTLNNKCHIQVVVIFEKKSRTKIRPFVLDFILKDNNDLGFRLLGLVQKVENRWSIDKYAAKEKDFQKYDKKDMVPFIDFIKDDGTPKYNWGKSVLNLREFNYSADEWKDFMYNYFGNNSMVMSILNNNKFLDYYKSNLIQEYKCEFRWSDFPKYLLEDKEDYIMNKGEEDEYHIGKVLYQWYTNNCLEIQTERRCGLLLWGERCTGKTMFATSLVNDPKYLCHVKNQFPANWQDNEEYKLMVLDDFREITIRNNLEAFKQLITGQAGVVTEKWVNSKTYAKPCIILSNNPNVVNYIIHNKELSDGLVVVYSGDVFIGPPEFKDARLNQMGLKNYCNAVGREKLEKALINRETNKEVNYKQKITGNILSFKEVKEIRKKKEKKVKNNMVMDINGNLYNC